MKKIFTVVALMLIVGSAFVTTTSALSNSNSEFLGSTNGLRWQKVNLRDLYKNDRSIGLVDWRTSNYSGHQQWFRIRVGNKIMGNRLVPVVGDGDYIISNTTGMGYGAGYYLESKREHIHNPTTSVRGYWIP